MSGRSVEHASFVVDRKHEAPPERAFAPQAWATFLTSPRGRRRLPNRTVGLKGSRAAARWFAKAFGAQLAPA